MKINSIDNTQFKALNISKVAPAHMKYIDKELLELRELGKKYNINIKSGWFSGYDMGYPTLEVSVSKLNSWFSKSKATAFLSGPYALGSNRSILNSVDYAISKCDKSYSIPTRKIYDNKNNNRNLYATEDVEASYPSFIKYCLNLY